MKFLSCASFFCSSDQSLKFSGKVLLSTCVSSLPTIFSGQSSLAGFPLWSVSVLNLLARPSVTSSSFSTTSLRLSSLLFRFSPVAISFSLSFLSFWLAFFSSLRLLILSSFSSASLIFLNSTSSATFFSSSDCFFSNSFSAL